MNEEIYSEWVRQERIPHYDNEASIIYFLKYVDKHSLRLNGFESNIFEFTNDAQTIQFTYNEIIQYVTNMKQGIAFPWSNFE